MGKETIMTERPKTKADAIKLGLKRYYPDEPCGVCGTNERRVQSSHCVECKRAWEREWRKKNKDKDKAMRAREVRKNAAGYKRRFEEYADRVGAEYISNLRKQWKQDNPDRVLASINKRRASKTQATPSWYNHEEVVLIYDECRKITEETGIAHEVDHIIPLVSDYVCGLHCTDNLQIITKEENLKKSNSLQLD